MTNQSKLSYSRFCNLMRKAKVEELRGSKLQFTFGNKRLTVVVVDVEEDQEQKFAGNIVKSL